MRKEVGLWIDRQKAVIVSIAYQGNGVKSAQSILEKHVYFSGVSSRDGWSTNQPDGKSMGSPAGYYDAVVAQLLDADSIQIFGPGEAKIKLESRLHKEHLGDQIVGVETVNKMSDRQIEARVWRYLLSL